MSTNPQDGTGAGDTPFDPQTESIGQDIYDIVKTTIACCTWLVRKGHPDLAHDMRDEFCLNWEARHDLWNECLADLVDFVQRKGETPDISIRQLMALVMEP
jgi:hypothetical protein